MLGLLTSAVIGAMPEALPGFKQFPQWAWTWFRDSAKTFLNFRMSLAQQTVQQQRLEALQKGNQATHDPAPVAPKTTGPQLLNE